MPSSTDNTSTSPAPMDIAHVVVQSCLEHAKCFTPLDVIRLSATCKSIAQLCQAKLAAASAAACQLLEAAAGVTAAPSVHKSYCGGLRSSKHKSAVPRSQLKLELTQQRRQDVASLQRKLQQAISTSGPLLTAVLISTPEVSMESAKALVQAGLEITYPLLLGAAYSHVQGFEVWILAQQRLGVPTALPSLAEYVCSCQDCGGLELPTTSQLRSAVVAMTPEDLADLLYLCLSVDPWHTCKAAGRACLCWYKHNRPFYTDDCDSDSDSDSEEFRCHLWLAEDIFQLVRGQQCLQLLQRLSAVAVGHLLSRITANAAVLGPQKGDKSWIYTPRYVIDGLRCWCDSSRHGYPRFLGDTLLQLCCEMPAAANLQQHILEDILENAFQVSGLAMGCCLQPVVDGLPVDVMNVLYDHLLSIRMMPDALYAMLWQAIACHQSDKAIELCLAAAAAGITQQLAPWQVHELLTAAITACPTVSNGRVCIWNTRTNCFQDFAGMFKMALTMTEVGPAEIFKRVPRCTCSRPPVLARRVIEWDEPWYDSLPCLSSPHTDVSAEFEWSCYKYSHPHGAWGDFDVFNAPKKSRLLWQEHSDADTDAREILSRHRGLHIGRWRWRYQQFRCNDNL